jgi:hypothetical protein
VRRGKKMRISSRDGSDPGFTLKVLFLRQRVDLLSQGKAAE